MDIHKELIDKQNKEGWNDTDKVKWIMLREFVLNYKGFELE